MKSSNKFFCIINILISIFIIMNFFISNFELYYDWSYFNTLSLSTLFGILTIIFSIINFCCKNKKIGIKYLIMGLLRFLPILVTLGLSKIDFLIKLIPSKTFFYMLMSLLLEETLFAIIEAIEIIIAIRIISNTNKMSDKKEKIIAKIFSAISIICIVFQIIIIGAAVILGIINDNNFEKAIALFEKTQETDLYIINEYDTARFICVDNEGNIINEEKYTDLLSNNIYEYTKEDKKYPLILAENEKENGTIINSKAETVFEFVGGSMLSLRDYLKEKNILEVKNADKEFNSDVQNYYLKRYDEIRKEFEDIEGNYYYFKNENITEKVLQVIVKDEVEEDLAFLENCYEGRLEEGDTNDIISLIENIGKKEMNIQRLYDFYNFEKDYYLIDFDNNTKIKLECNNLYYTSDEENEYILLYSSKDIPFLDENEVGYFNINDGTKSSFKNNYIIGDIDDNNIIISNTELDITEVIDKNLNKKIKTLNGIIQGIFEEMYITYYKDEGVFCVYDKNFNLVGTSKYTPEILGENIIELINEEYREVYFIKDNTHKMLLNGDTSLSSTNSIWIKDINNELEHINENMYNKVIFIRIIN